MKIKSIIPEYQISNVENIQIQNTLKIIKMQYAFSHVPSISILKRLVWF